MTQKLYYENQYIKDFTANVVSCVKCDRGYEIILDKTAFFPEGGGAPGSGPRSPHLYCRSAGLRAPSPTPGPWFQGSDH